MNTVVTQNICAEGVALRCNKCNAKGHFASVCRSKRNTVNFERHKAYEVEREGTKPHRGKAESDGTGPFVGDIERDQTKPPVESGQSTAFFSVVDGSEKKDAWFVTLKVRRLHESHQGISRHKDVYRSLGYLPTQSTDSERTTSSSG